MSKDRKTKTKAMGAVIGVSAAVGTALIVALSLSMGGAPTASHNVVYPSDAAESPHGMEGMTEPPAP
jgi:hypothetical protein